MRSCICIDSDDWLADNAIELILNLWDTYKADDIAGIIGLDIKTDGNIIGTRLKTGERIYPLRNVLLPLYAALPQRINEFFAHSKRNILHWVKKEQQSKIRT